MHLPLIFNSPVGNLIIVSLVKVNPLLIPFCLKYSLMQLNVLMFGWRRHCVATVDRPTTISCRTELSVFWLFNQKLTHSQIWISCCTMFWFYASTCFYTLNRHRYAHTALRNHQWCGGQRRDLGLGCGLWDAKRQYMYIFLYVCMRQYVSLFILKRIWIMIQKNIVKIIN